MIEFVVLPPSGGVPSGAVAVRGVVAIAVDVVVVAPAVVMVSWSLLTSLEWCSEGGEEEKEEEEGDDLAELPCMECAFEDWPWRVVEEKDIEQRVTMSSCMVSQYKVCNARMHQWSQWLITYERKKIRTLKSCELFMFYLLFYPSEIAIECPH